MSFSEGRTVFAQGDSCDAVFYIPAGKVKLTVVSKTGKEATIAILGVGDFFGEDSLAGHRLLYGECDHTERLPTHANREECDVASASRKHTFSDLFVEHLLLRNIRYQEDLIDHIFNSSEKRLARILLIFAGFGKVASGKKRRFP